MTRDRKQTLSVLWSQSFQFPKGSFANSERMLFEKLWNHPPMFKVWIARSLCFHDLNALIRCSTFFIFLQQYLCCAVLIYLKSFWFHEKIAWLSLLPLQLSPAHQRFLWFASQRVSPCLLMLETLTTLHSPATRDWNWAHSLCRPCYHKNHESCGGFHHQQEKLWQQSSCEKLWGVVSWVLLS